MHRNVSPLGFSNSYNDIALWWFYLLDLADPPHALLVNSIIFRDYKGGNIVNDGHSLARVRGFLH